MQPDPNLSELVRKLSAQFDVDCQARHNMGAEKYGPVKFLDSDNDLNRMLSEELVDAANYARYLYIRLHLINNQMKSMTTIQKDSPLGPSGVVSPHRSS